MSNEWSASVGNLMVDGRTVNHQWSKSIAFEHGLPGVLAATLAPAPEYFSLLRPQRVLGGEALRRPRPLPPRLSQLQPGLPP